MFRYAPDPIEKRRPERAEIREFERDFRAEQMGVSRQMSWEVADMISEAIEAYNEWAFLEMPPHAGGTLAQEVWWKEAMMCVRAAKVAAEEQLKERKNNQPKMSATGAPVL